MENAVILTYKQFDELTSRLRGIEKYLEKMSGFNFKHIVDNNQFCKLMKISYSTAQRWREQGLISYSQIDRKIMYTRDDIDEFIKKHHIKGTAISRQELDLKLDEEE